MDFELNPEQQAVLEAVESLLAKHAGPQRAIELAAAGGYDESLDAALEEAGFGELATAMGRLEAALLVEAVSRRAGVVSVGARALALPAVSASPVPGPVCVVAAGHAGPVRFAAHARTLLVLDGDHVRQVDLPPGACPPVASNFGYPMGRVPVELASGGQALGSGSGPALVDAWRLALAAEATGAMEAALDQTVAYLKERRQFGKTIGSFQAVQHRLAECAIQLEASRWLCREAAFQSASSQAIATAAAFALDAAGHVFAETHQLSGAIGFTREHDLHVWSMRLHALRQELGGVAGHRRAVVDARWSGSAG
ncbi:MAG: acyl-CoA dehydrogenase family protein [Myxococcota bacterium]|nr:acyl-CoA dehydrogenase family protein [Myxococcota bacterium]